jgi:peptidylprolyl isomerase
MGNVTIGLYDDMPITAGNFLNLTKSGIYDNTIFHRVVANFVVQGGDPTGTGEGDPSIPTIPDELPNRHSNVMGNVAMAKTAEANSASSQFFVNLKDNSADLDSNYSVFGKVIDGMDVVQAIGRVETNPSGELQDRPLEDVRLIKAIALK